MKGNARCKAGLTGSTRLFNVLAKVSIGIDGVESHAGGLRGYEGGGGKRRGCLRVMAALLMLYDLLRAGGEVGGWGGAGR